jgi:diaminopimelate epimerase
MTTHVIKAHAYGNDFVYIELAPAETRDWSGVARSICDRHRGVGADGLVLFDRLGERPRMMVINADGSRAEVSGNGVRGLGAILAWDERRGHGSIPTAISIDTDAGVNHLTVLEAEGETFTIRSAMPVPAEIRPLNLDVDGEAVPAVALRVGNPQCVVFETELDESRYRRLGQRIECHEAFPNRTNVSFARVVAPNRVEILLWERGVGPTMASGTGACGAGVAAIEFRGCARELDVSSPGGVQHVSWKDGRLFLTGWAKIVWQGEWME